MDADYDIAVDKLPTYFEPEKNIIYQTYVSWQAKQGPDETIDEFQTRLRRLTKNYEFHDQEFEIKMQIVCNDTSIRLRKRSLRDADYTLKDM